MASQIVVTDEFDARDLKANRLCRAGSRQYSQLCLGLTLRARKDDLIDIILVLT
jgi:hypothetical protein